MDRLKIEMILKLQRQVGLTPVIDPYAAEVARILKRPSWLHPILRARFDQQFETRVQLILSEYAKQMLNQIETASN